MSKEIFEFRTDASNVDTLNAIRENASSTYQQRIPEATKANVKSIQNALVKYRPLRNEALDALVNQIGMYIFRSNNWTNPLGKFKMGMLESGDTIQETKLGLVKAKSFDPRRDVLEKDLFGQKAVEAQSSWHRINRQDRYDITVQDSILKRALVDPQGLANFIVDLLAVPQRSDELDEYTLMVSLFKEFDDADGFHRVHVDDVGAEGSTEAMAKYALRRLREMAQTLPFPSRDYNPAHMPSHANPEQLELFVTPQFAAATDVEALAGAFNTERAAMPGRQTIIREQDFRIPGCQAILTTDEFFVVADTLMETRQMSNPGGLYDNYFMHHHQIISASRFAPAIMFWTGEGDTITIHDAPVTAVDPIVVYANGESEPYTGELARGAVYHVESSADHADGEVGVNAVVLTMQGNQSDRTVITQTGTLYISPDEESDAIIITATSVDEGADGKPKKVTKGFNLSGEILHLWPNPAILPDPATPTP